MELIRFLSDLKFTIDYVLTLEADYEQTLYLYFDTDFSVHADMKIHTGSVFYLGKGIIVADYTKQKFNTRNLIESELIGVNDIIGKIFWTRRFLECQGFKVKVNIIYQYFTSIMKLQKNDKDSSGKRTLYYDIKYFYVTYLIRRDKV